MIKKDEKIIDYKSKTIEIKIREDIMIINIILQI